MAAEPIQTFGAFVEENDLETAPQVLDIDAESRMANNRTVGTFHTLAFNADAPYGGHWDGVFQPDGGPKYQVGYWSDIRRDANLTLILQALANGPVGGVRMVNGSRGKGTYVLFEPA